MIEKYFFCDILIGKENYVRFFCGDIVRLISEENYVNEDMILRD